MQCGTKLAHGGFAFDRGDDPVADNDAAQVGIPGLRHVFLNHDVGFDIHETLVNEEGYDPSSDEYYSELDKRIRVAFPTKFGKRIGELTSYGNQRFDDFITQHLKAIPGDMIDENGKVLGKHKGLICYTLGQRKGIGLGGIKNNEGDNNTHKPWFAAKKDLENNTLTVVQDTNHPLLINQLMK
jgi:hypothetical protein